MTSSYIHLAYKIAEELPIVTSNTMYAMQELDQVSQDLSIRIDELIGERDRNPSKFTKKSETELERAKYILEDMVERKQQLAVRNYDYIDQHIHIINQQLKIVEQSMKNNRLDDILVYNTTAISTKDAVIVEKKRGRGRPSLIELTRKNEAINKSKSNSDLIGGIITDVDPNEPVYCTCRQIAYGEMIACDNDSCLIEWFHYPCVNLTKKPRNVWYCSSCRNK